MSTIRSAMRSNRYQFAAVIICLLCRSVTVAEQPPDWDREMADGASAMTAKQYTQAENSYRQALAFAEGHYKKDARISASLVKLAEACNAQGKKEDAEILANRAVTAMEDALKVHNAKDASQELLEVDASAGLWDKVGDIFSANEQYADAERMYQQVIAIRIHYAEEKFPAEPKNEDFFRVMAQTFTNAQAKVAAAEDKLGNLYIRENKLPNAEGMFRQSLAIRQKAFPDQPPVAQSLSQLARCYALQEQYGKAEPLYKQVVEILEHSNLRDTADMAACLENYALVLRKTGHDAEAKSSYDRAQALRTKLSSTH